MVRIVTYPWSRSRNSTALDSPPDDMDILYDELEDPTTASTLLERISSRHAGWLAQHIKKRVEVERERAREEMEGELKVLSRVLFPFNPTRHQHKQCRRFSHLVTSAVSGCSLYKTLRRNDGREIAPLNWLSGTLLICDLLMMIISVYSKLVDDI